MHADKHSWGRTTSGKDVFQIVESIEKAISDGNFNAVLRLSDLAININDMDPSTPASERAKLYGWRADARLALNDSVADALGDAQEALRLCPSAKAYGLLARVHQELGHAEEARTAEEHAKRLTSRAQLEEMLAAVDGRISKGDLSAVPRLAVNGMRLCNNHQVPELRPAFQRRLLHALLLLGRFTEAEDQGQVALTEAIRRMDVAAIEHFEEVVKHARACTTPAPSPGTAAPSDTPPSPVASPAEPRETREPQGAAERQRASSVEEPAAEDLREDEPQQEPQEPLLKAERKGQPGRIGRSSTGSGQGGQTSVIVTIAVLAMGVLLAVGVFSLFMICRSHRDPETSVAMCVYNSLKEVKDFIELFAVPLQLWTVVTAGVVTAVSWLRYRVPG